MLQQLNKPSQLNEPSQLVTRCLLLPTPSQEFVTKAHCVFHDSRSLIPRMVAMLTGPGNSSTSCASSPKRGHQSLIYLPCPHLFTSPSEPRPGGAVLRKREVNTVAHLAQSLGTGDFPPPVHLQLLWLCTEGRHGHLVFLRSQESSIQKQRCLQGSTSIPSWRVVCRHLCLLPPWAFTSHGGSTLSQSVPLKRIEPPEERGKTTF